MFFIGICDDEELHRKHVKELCVKYFAKYPQEYRCIEFESGEEFLQFEDHRLHLLFLDIELGGMTGIEILLHLENADNVWRVVFISSHEEMVFDTFGVKTLGFERKPAQYERIAKWISIALKENNENLMHECYVGKEKYYFTQEEVYYLEAEGSYTHIHLKEQRYMLSERLKLWEVKLKSAPMVRIHKSYLINMLHVKSWEKDSVVLTNGIVLPQGRQYKKEAKEAYLKFIGDMARGRM